MKDNKQTAEQIEQLKKRAEELRTDLANVEDILRAEERLSRHFDASELIDAEIHPLWLQIYALCEKHSLPVLFAIMRSYDEKGVNLSTGHVLPRERTDGRLIAAKAALAGEVEIILTDAPTTPKNVPGGCNCGKCAAGSAEDEETPST